MSDRTLARLAWAMYLVVGALLLVSLAFLVFFLVVDAPWDAGRTLSAVLTFVFPTVGILVARVQPRNQIGWTLLGIGLVWQLLSLADPYIWYAYVGEPGSLWRPDLVVAATSSLWIPAVGLMGVYLILWFPNGHLLSPRWRAFAWAAGVNLAVQFVVTPFIPLSLRWISAGNPDVPRSPNPLGIEPLRPVAGVWEFGVVLIGLSILASAVSLVLRFRRSRGDERLQLKWMATAGAAVATFFLLFIILAFITDVLKIGAHWAPLVDAIFENASSIVFALLPIAIGVAILRYRLYEIDFIINRALVYGALTAVLGSAYAVIVTVAGTILQGSDIVTGGATLTVAALFQPLRRRIQGFIDRRFYRRRYDAARTVEAFSIRLRNEVDVEAMRTDLLASVQKTMQPRTISLWLRARH
jgi:hypothetical protein